VLSAGAYASSFRFWFSALNLMSPDWHNRRTEEVDSCHKYIFVESKRLEFREVALKVVHVDSRLYRSKIESDIVHKLEVVATGN